MDTTNILFLSGGAFNGLDKIVERRVGRNVIGFNADIRSKKDRKIGELLQMVQPEDLVQFGMIPEFSGRVPVTATLHELTRDELIRVLVEPKNAVVRQYEKLFGMEHVSLRFPDETIEAIADVAIEKETGARGLRAILEESMLDVMFDIPSQNNVDECVITPGVIKHDEEPLLVYKQEEVPEETESDQTASA